MLHAIYETANLPSTSAVVVMREGRGEVTFLLQRDAPLAAILDEMNRKVHELCQQHGWLQLWDGEVTAPVVTFELEDLPPGCGVDIQETRGRMRILVDGGISVAQFAGVMSAASEKVLSGGQWYQLWDGEIVSNASTDPAARAPSL